MFEVLEQRELKKLPAILRRNVLILTCVTQQNVDDHFPNMVRELSNIHEHRSKPTYASYTFQPLMSFCDPYETPRHFHKLLNKCPHLKATFSHRKLPSVTSVSDTLTCGSCATFLFLPHFDDICDLN